VCRQIVAIVAHLHALGIAHGDLKIENFLIDHADVVRLCDLGMATFDTTLHVMNGTSTTRAPEVWLLPEPGVGGGVAAPAGMPPVDAILADLWSLGMTLYMLLEKRFIELVPHGGPIIVMTSSQMTDDGYRRFAAAQRAATPAPFVMGPRHPEQSRDLIARFLRVNPDQRLAAQDALGHAFFSF
jgi:serine/threonine protein kinase